MSEYFNAVATVYFLATLCVSLFHIVDGRHSHLWLLFVIYLLQLIQM